MEVLGGVCERVDMAERVGNIVVGEYGGGDGGMMRGVVFCSGVDSNALYAVGYDIRNI